MKFRRVLLAALALAGSVLAAAPLTRDAAVYAKPDPSSAVLKTLPAGTEPTVAVAATAPEGWMAVTLPGPHDVFVPNRSVDKELNIKTGSALYAKSDFNAAVVGTMEEGDKADLGPLTADFTGFKLHKPLTGYLKLGLPAAATVAAPTAPSRPVGVATPVVPAGIGRDAVVPRFYEGRFTATRNFLTYKHPYNFQILDPNGERFAYLDVSRLLLTDKIDLYLDRLVIIYGTARRVEVPGRKGIVIDVESLHLK